MKPKKKVRKSGYYYVQFRGAIIPIIGEYDPSGDYFELTGVDAKFPSKLFSYIYPTPITIPMTRLSRSKHREDGHGKPKPRKK